MFSERTDRLLRWYESHARDLPWRHTRDPYAIWISEVMLQQTQVVTVIPRFHAWMKHFPDIERLARAGPDEVMKAWEGLGYYRRARFIHTAARKMVAEHDARFPDSFEDILDLPGIGRSTAGAIASICFGAKTPVLDGNVRRVLRRWSGKPHADEKYMWRLAQQAIDASGDAARWNQAMMELGAILCTPRHPNCTACPVSYQCTLAFHTETMDGMKKKAPVRDLHWEAHLHLCSRRGIWLSPRPETGIWAGLWTPPLIELKKKPDQPPCHIHLLSHRRLHLYGIMRHGDPKGPGQWASDIRQFALPAGIHRLLSIHGIF